LFNIGGEGQAYVAGLGVALPCLWLDQFMPWYIIFPAAILGSALVGGFWALIPAWLQAKRGSHVVITTIMFNFIASSLMVYVLVDVLKPAGSMAPQTRTFADGGQLPRLDWLLASVGLDIGGAPFNMSFLLALVAAFVVWLVIWRTKLGYEIRTMGHSPRAASYAGIRQSRIIIITMMMSGALAGMMALNPIMGDQHRMQLDFVAGAGFVGIAVALMGRSHPVGIVPAAILFGMLYQGGAEISFEMPQISRDMITIIQGLVILFAGALENMFRPAITLFCHPGRGSLRQVHSCGGVMIMEYFDTLIVILQSTVRVSVPLILAALAGLYSERSGIFDIGLEGKMLAAAFAGGAAAAVTGSALIGLAAAIFVSVCLALVHGFASITQRGNQIVSGVAINFIALGATVILGQAWFRQGGRTPQLSGDARFTTVELPFAAEIADIPVIGSIYSNLCRAISC
jgi:ABC-type uncharacterized transport system permease subunit